MKQPALVTGTLVLVALLAWLGFRMATPSHDEVMNKAVASSEPPLPPPTTTNTDATEVFQRAFWKRPTEEDHILHAERREWADADVLDRWQWFIEVDPSEPLARYLNEQNPFSLSEPKGKVTLPGEPRPEWFPDTAEGFTAKQSMDGLMLFLIQPDNGRLFATSQGRGFAKPAAVPPSPPRPVQSSSAPGRLPTTPPPLPKKP